MTWAEPEVEGVEPWDRRAGEPSRAYAAFRVFRDLPAHRRSLALVAAQVDGSERRARAWAARWGWRERADAWDDACHRLEDRERLELIREMHLLHRRAGRQTITKALRGLDLLQPEDMPPTLIARLLELGAKLERSTLVTSVEELQGIDVTPEESEDPWERIAQELTPPPGS